MSDTKTIEIELGNPKQCGWSNHQTVDVWICNMCGRTAYSHQATPLYSVVRRDTLPNWADDGEFCEQHQRPWRWVGPVLVCPAHEVLIDGE